MRVLFVNSIGRLGGAERSLCELAVAIYRCGIETAVAIPDGEAAELLRMEGIRTYAIPQFRLHRPGANPFRIVADAVAFLRARAATRRAIRDFSPDIIHANSLQAALAAMQHILKRQKNGAPFFMHVRDIRFPARAMRFAARRVSCVIAISKAVESRLLDVLPPVLHGKVRRIQNAIDADAFLKRRIDRTDARKRLGLPSDAVIIGMMSHFAPWKHHDYFIAMAKALSAQSPDSAFAIAGTDIGGDNAEIASALRDAARDPLLAGRLHLLGEVDGACFLSAIDCLVHSAVGEPFGRVIAEAKAFGLPIVAMDSAGSAEQLAGYPHGRLVPVSGDIPLMLAEAVIRHIRH